MRQILRQKQDSYADGRLRTPYLFPFRGRGAVVDDYLVAADYLGKTNSEYKLVWTGTSDEYMGICMKKDNTVLLEKVNTILEEMKADGTLKKLYIDSFGIDLSDSIKD